MGAKRPEPVPTKVICTTQMRMIAEAERDDARAECDDLRRQLEALQLAYDRLGEGCELLKQQLAESRERERELLAACKSAEWYGCDPISFAKIQAALRDCGEGGGDVVQT